MTAVVDAQHLRQAGRTPATPFRIRLADGRELLFVRPLRVLPGKRVVGEAWFDSTHVLAKIYIAKGSERHWQQEITGIGRLRDAGVPTPELIAAGACQDGGHFVLTGFLPQAESLSTHWSRLEASPAAAAASLLDRAVLLVGKMHAAGLTHKDLHFGNFLVDGERLLLIDGDAVQCLPADPASRHAAAMDNLALLLGQLPSPWDVFHPDLQASYRARSGMSGGTLEQLREAVAKIRQQRLVAYLNKSVRDCSLFSVQQTPRLFIAAKRDRMDDLQAVFADPDACLEKGVKLKNGATCTVARVELAGCSLVVKRYNLKDAGHALSRLFRPSRAWHAWHEGLRLRFLGLPTPEPLALIEERFGPLRRRAWLVTEYCPGLGLGKHLSADAEPPAAEAEAIRSLFEALYREKLSHGDLKAANLLWDGSAVQLIDLDAMTRHRTDRAFQRAWRKDRARLLRNWPEFSVMHHWLERTLPAAG